jgi:D-alanyl-D-alanine carboxypeptidase (penicillin-binding protein 5/6)
MKRFTHKRTRWALAAIFVVLIALLYLRPVPKATPQIRQPQVPPARAVHLPWPDGGQAAVGAEGYGLLERHGDNSPVPIGSTAKIITALAVLKQKPLSPPTAWPRKWG